MPDLRGSYLPLEYLLLPELRPVHLPAATWATGLTAAENLAELVADLHAAGYVVGDLKKENLWVDQRGQIAISDVDSFQFTDSAGFFPCTSRTPGYTAPEGIGAVDARLDDASDDFVLAVLVYQLLMIGMHPFFGQPANGQPYVSYDDNIAMGRARLVSPRSVVIRPGDPPGSVLPADLQELFRHCFDDRGRGDRSARPPASQWRQSLHGAAAADRLRWCDRVQTHVHTADRQACPWCELAAADTDPYPDLVRLPNSA
jgi:DNA-binding helix-hairpin-helix protein with protein kinase domain